VGFVEDEERAVTAAEFGATSPSMENTTSVTTRAGPGDPDRSDSR
jgi:hypothetical protein